MPRQKGVVLRRKEGELQTRGEGTRTRVERRQVLTNTSVDGIGIGLLGIFRVREKGVVD